ncbi:MAG TPA: hypothetical protein VFN67_16240 [Polyangiales bacterium]|nr:hypothetical protein [Polyangiales bacterium]
MAPVAPPLPATFTRPTLCDRDARSDVVRDLFCAESGKHIASLADLETALGLTNPEVLGTVYGGAVALAHSTSLSGDLVSELNPRTIVTTARLFVAFSRGIQQVEMAALDHTVEGHYNFYLVQFQQACNLAAEGCRPGDLYTPRIESDWQSLTLEDDESLKNTPSDCRQCHQRGVDKPVLLMREFDGPWTHFFAPDQEDPAGFPEVTGSALTRDYLRAKGDEIYANLSVDVMRSTVGFTLQNLVARPQPLLFDGSLIMNERWPYKDGYKAAPEKSPTWYAQYEAFKRGEQLPMPYFEPRVSDPTKQAQLTAAYQRYRNGELDAAELPDFADIFPDDPQTRAEIGLQTEPGAKPADTMIQACATCHNDVLDQNISRARFSVALGRMSREEIELAITRLEAPRDAVGAMPPPGRRQIAAQDRAALVTYLRAAQRPAEDDALLERAAKLGMSGTSTK